MKLFFRKYGSGYPLIILHGLYGSSDNWVTIARNLADTFTVYLPDQRNHGQSPRSDRHDYDSMAGDLLELAGELGLEKFFLAGHSMGGKTAIAFALKYPERLNGLLVADISPFVNENSKRTVYEQHLTILNAILTIDASDILSRTEAEKILSAKIGSERIIGLIMKNLQRTDDNHFTWKINAEVLKKNLRNLMEGIDRTHLISEQVTGFPVIFLRGEKSDYVPEEDIPDIRKVFPAAEFITIPEAGHWIHADNPAEVTRNIRRLVSDL